MVNASLQDGDRLAVAAGVIARDTHGNALPQQMSGAVLAIVAPVMSITLSPELPYVLPGGLLNITATGHNAGHTWPVNTTVDLLAPYSGQLVNWSGPFYSADGIRFVVDQQTNNGNFNATFSFRIAALPTGLELETRATLYYQDALGKQRGPMQASCVVTVESGRPDVPQLNLTGSASPERVAPGSRQNNSYRMENTGTNSSR
jgi:hypothetical protein